jgi:hypothetical protein
MPPKKSKTAATPAPANTKAKAGKKRALKEESKNEESKNAANEASHDDA